MKTNKIFTIIFAFIIQLFLANVLIAQTAEELYRKGFSEYLHHNYEEAIDYFNRAIELNPDYFRAYEFRGISYSILENYNKALENFTKCIELKPDYASVYEFRGLDYSKLENYNKALENFTKCIELKPDYESAYYNRALVYEKLEKYDEAKKDYTIAEEKKRERLRLEVGELIDDIKKCPKQYLTPEAANYLGREKFDEKERENAKLCIEAAFSLGELGDVAMESVPILIERFPTAYHVKIYKTSYLASIDNQSYNEWLDSEVEAGNTVALNFGNPFGFQSGYKYKDLINIDNDVQTSYVQQSRDRFGRVLGISSADVTIITTLYYFPGSYALSKITGQDFGNDRDKWLQWWNQYKGNAQEKVQE